MAGPCLRRGAYAVLLVRGRPSAPAHSQTAVLELGSGAIKVVSGWRLEVISSRNLLCEWRLAEAEVAVAT